MDEEVEDEPVVPADDWPVVPVDDWPVVPEDDWLVVVVDAGTVAVVVVVVVVVVVPHVPRPGTAVQVNPLASALLAVKVTSVFQKSEITWVVPLL